MNNEKFESKMRQELNSNTPDVLDRIKQSERFTIPEKPQKKSFLEIFNSRGVRYSLVSTFMIVILAVFMLRGTTENQVYASTVILDINPQIEITLDEDDKVMTVVALNNDGDTIINHDVEYKNMTLDEFIEYLIEKLDQQGIIISTEDNVILIHVDGVSESVKARVLEKLQERITAETVRHNKVMKFIKTNDVELTDDQLAEVNRVAKEYNINPARIIIIQRIRSLDDSYTIRELATKTMRELYNLENELTNPNNNQPYRNNDNGRSGAM